MGATLKHAWERLPSMRCEFCERQIAPGEAENVVLLRHVNESAACGEQFRYLLENLRVSWTPAMSGG